jgi:hypothetical protein
LAWHDGQKPRVFLGFGLLLAAFGAGNLICWLLIDKRLGRRKGRLD